MATWSDSHRMRAVVYDTYGPPEVLRLQEVERPVPKNDEVLIKVHASAVNRTDTGLRSAEYFISRFVTGLIRPRHKIPGTELAGEIEAVGPNVTEFQVGDEVFGVSSKTAGAHAEFVCLPESAPLAHKPTAMTFEEAAAVADGVILALSYLRRVDLRTRRSILIYGASGSIGTAAVQLARYFDADVTAVCDTKNVELIGSLGADRVIDYTREDFTKGDRRYDVVLDNVGNRGVLEVRRVLVPQGIYILIGGGGPDANPLVGPFIGPVNAMFVSWFVDQDMGMFLSHGSGEDLTTLAGMMQSGAVTPVVDRRYELAETAEAMRYLETGRARGKVIVTIP